MIKFPKALPWSVPLAQRQVPETGKHLALVADETSRAAVAKVVHVREIPRLEAVLDVSRYGADGLRVEGTVVATVGQDCVVSLEPIETQVRESIDLFFVPKVPTEGEPIADDAPEPLVNGAVDLGAIAVEFLILGIDPYPRKPDAVFVAPPIDKPAAVNPFDALAVLKKGQSGE